ncbi:MAG: T9SS type A sorting domain-containing protein [bacterium]
MKLRYKILFFVIIFNLLSINAQSDYPVTNVNIKCSGVLYNKAYGLFTGALFLPGSNYILVLQNVEENPDYNSTPIVFDPDNCEVIREFETLNKSKIYDPVITKDGKYLIADSDLGIIVWDIATGHIVKKLKQCVRFCLSADGSKIYSTKNGDDNHSGIIRVYDIVTFEETEIFSDHDFWGAQEIACSPDGNTLAVSVSHYPIGDPNNDTSASVILINMNKNLEYKIVDNFRPPIGNLNFSPNGKYLAFTQRVPYMYSTVRIYNLITNEKECIYDSDLKLLFNQWDWMRGFLTFFDSNTISFVFGDNSVIWNINEHRINGAISFRAFYNDIKSDKILMCDDVGNIVIEDISSLSVDKIKVYKNYITFINNQLEITSDKTYIAEVFIYDLNGKLVSNLGSTAFVNGKNNIIVNQSLAKGVYILNINSDAEQISKKFIIE